MDIELMRHAYDGYVVGDEKSMFNPNSVMMALEDGRYDSHWTRTASFATIEQYIKIDADSVREKIISMLNGESVLVEVTSFRNDMKNVENSDDVLTLLVHLGYLSYDPETQSVRIPDSEVAGEFRLAIGSAGWGEVSHAIKDSLTLLDKTIKGDAEYVSNAFDNYRFAASSILGISESCLFPRCASSSKSSFTSVNSGFDDSRALTLSHVLTLTSSTFLSLGRFQASLICSRLIEKFSNLCKHIALA
jgi:hypothetical protein